MFKTIMQKQQEVTHEWYVVDVKDKVLGRAATKIASLLMGKNRADFTPHVDGGAGVIVTNCDKIRVTGKKSEEKVYKRYSGYPGGQTETVYKDMMVKSPKTIMRHAVKGMIPKNKLGARMIKRLKLYTGSDHDQVAQQPKEIKL